MPDDYCYMLRNFVPDSNISNIVAVYTFDTRTEKHSSSGNLRSKSRVIIFQSTYDTHFSFGARRSC